jgi:hypothetical protein
MAMKGLYKVYNETKYEIIYYEVQYQYLVHISS